jgi:hypothetical protein
VSTTHRTPILGLSCLLAGGLLVAAPSGAAASSDEVRTPSKAAATSAQGVDRRLANQEVRAIRDSRPDQDRGRFTSEQNVFLPSTIALADLESRVWRTRPLPLYTAPAPPASGSTTSSPRPRTSSPPSASA